MGTIPLKLQAHHKPHQRTRRRRHFCEVARLALKSDDVHALPTITVAGMLGL